MSDTEYRAIYRHNIIEDLETLASPEKQLKFQHDVPFVNISVELACNWFDGDYLPDEPKFVALFSAIEWKAIVEFSTIFDSVTAEFDNVNYPEISELLERADWHRVIEAARIASAVFEENESG